MRIAVFTNQFPIRVATFISRDIRALLDAGFDVDILPFYPLDPAQWRYVPEVLSESVLSKTKVKHIGFSESLASLRPWPLQKVSRFVRDTVAISASSAGFGVRPLAKSLYVFPKAWAWSKRFTGQYDH